MRLQLQTWREVERYLEDRTGIIVPIGSTEQHGPNGLIGTDALCPEVIGQRVGEEMGVLVGPTIGVGMAQHHLAFPGSVTLRPSTLMAVIGDYVASLARNGFDRFYFLNGHGGNIATVNAAFSEIYAERSFLPPQSRGSNAPGIRCRLANWFDFPEVTALEREFFGDRNGAHATPGEISVTQAAFPDHIKHAEMEPATPAPRAFHDAEDYRSIFPDGRIEADSFLARPEYGARLIDACVAAVRKDYERFVSEA